MTTELVVGFSYDPNISHNARTREKPGATVARCVTYDQYLATLFNPYPFFPKTIYAYL